MKRFTTLFLSLLPLLAPPVAISADALSPQTDRMFFERAWQISEGLPENTVVCALQDTKGYLWVGTQMGLYRFDGIRFREVDAGTGYDVIDFSPRWPVTHYREIRYATGYELTGQYVDCRGVLTDVGLRYNLRSPARKIEAHILLPDGQRAVKLLVNGVETEFKTVSVDNSFYVEASVAVANGVADFEVLY